MITEKMAGPPARKGGVDPELSMSSRTSQVRRAGNSWLSWSNLAVAALLILTISLAVSVLWEGQS